MKNKKSALVSFIISIHNASIENVRKCISCVIDQTYQYTEIILIDDINSKKVSSYLKYLEDKFVNIILIKNHKNMGLTRSLIRGINHSSGNYIARQDIDDISDLTRIEKQIEFLRNHSKVVLLGTGTRNIDHTHNTDKNLIIDLPHDKLIEKMFKINPFCHSSVIFKKDAYLLAGGYDTSYYTAQDLDLWFRMSNYGELAILNEILVTRQLFSESISKKLIIALSQVYNCGRIRLREQKRLKVKMAFIKIVYTTIRIFGATIIYDRLIRMFKFVKLIK